MKTKIFVMDRWIWTFSVLAGFVHGVLVCAALKIGIYCMFDGSLELGALLIVCGVALGASAFSHLTFLGIWLRRLERNGHSMHVPRGIARFLARLLDVAGSG